MACVCNAKAIFRTSQTGSINKTTIRCSSSPSETTAISVCLTHPSGPTVTRYMRLRLSTVQSNPAPSVRDPSLPWDQCCKGGVSAAQNKNIKVILLYQMLGKLKFDKFFKKSLFYERWTLREGNWLPGFTDPGGAPLARRLRAPQDAQPELREPALMPYFEHRPPMSALYTLTRSLCTNSRSYWTI